MRLEGARAAVGWQGSPSSRGLWEPPSLELPRVATPASEAVDARTLPFLLERAVLVEKEEEEKRNSKAAKDRERRMMALNDKIIEDLPFTAEEHAEWTEWSAWPRSAASTSSSGKMRKKR